MYLKWNSLMLSIILILFLSGCLDSDPEDLINNDGEKETFEIIRRNTIMNERTDFGMTNISYSIMDNIRSGERIVNITVKIENESNINSVGIKYWTDGGGCGGGMKKISGENVYYSEREFHNFYFDIWVIFYEKGELLFDDLNGSSYNKNEVNYIHPFTITYREPEGYCDTKISFTNIEWGYNPNDPDKFNVSFQVNSSSDVKDPVLRYLIFKKNGGRMSSTGQELTIENDWYNISFEISIEDREKIGNLVFSISASNLERNRFISDIIWV